MDGMGIEPLFGCFEKRNSGTFVTGCAKNPMASEAPNPWPPAAGATKISGRLKGGHDAGHFWG